MTETGSSAPRVLLVSVNTEENPYPVYPLGLEYLRAPLERSGFVTHIADCRLTEARGESLGGVLLSFKPGIVLVSMRNFDNNDSRNTVCYLAKTLSIISDIRKTCGVPIVLGGSGYSLFPEEILSQSEADFGMVGPAEHCVVELVLRIMAGSSPASIPGVVVRTGKECSRIPAKTPGSIEPLVSRSPDLLRFYWEQGGIPNIQLKRGCPFSCIYCTYPLLDGHEVVERDVTVVVDEMQAMYEKQGVDHFFVVDSVFNLIPALSRAFAEEIIRRNMRIHWTAYFIPRGLPVSDLKLMKESGLDGVEFGVDTLCPELLTRWGKAFTVSDVMASAAACEESGVPYAVYLIFGGPGETRDTMEETIAAAGECRKAVIMGFIGMRIYNGTALCKLARSEGLISDSSSLVVPQFYVSPALDRDYLARRCDELGNLRNWMVAGRSLAVKKEIARMIQKRGFKGPMWQQLSPQ